MERHGDSVRIHLLCLLCPWLVGPSVPLLRTGKCGPYCEVLYICETVLMISLQLFDLVYREEILQNVIKSVTKNIQSLLLTGVLALILVYFFSIIGFLFFSHDFLMESNPYHLLEGTEHTGNCMVEGTCIGEEDWPIKREASCETLMMCIVTTLKEGLRNGGGIGDVLRKPSTSVSTHVIGVVLFYIFVRILCFVL